MANATATAPPMTSAGPLSGEERREAGRAYFTKVLTHVLANISHPEMAALADWATNEPGCLHTSQLSHLRNAKMRMLGVKSLDALGRINECAWAFHNDRRGQFKAMGTAQTTVKIEQCLERYVPVLHPDSGRPINAGDLMMIYLGYLKLDLPGDDPVAAARWGSVAAELGHWFEALLEERDVRFRDAVKIIDSAWSGTNSQKLKLVAVLSGLDDYSADEVAEAWSAITKAVAVLLDETISESDLIEIVAK